MSEEKPVFKITDRRLFNADGTPREGAREDEPPAAETSAAPAPATAGGDAAPFAETEARGASELDAATQTGGPTAASSSAREPESRDAAAASAPPGERHDEPTDPQGFMMVVEFVASFAADALGLVEHPGAVGREVNLPLARQCIDMLATLRQKTRGNLNEEEQHFLDLILSQLRMQYVALTTSRTAAPGGGPRGFSGGDITGGR